MLAWQDGTPPRQEDHLNNLSLDIAVSQLLYNKYFKKMFISITGATIISERSREKSSLGFINSFDACSFSAFAIAHGNTA